MRTATIAVALCALLLVACSSDSSEELAALQEPVSTMQTELAQPSPTPPTTATPAATSRIAFASDRDGNGEIYLMNADGSNQTRLTNNLGQDYGLSWLPVEMGSLSTT